MRLADYIAEYLEQLGVQRVFLLSGGGMMHLLDAVSRRPKLKYICNHHEQASAMAAEGYARQSGSLGVCYATSGPGGTNTITGVAGAWLDSSPVLFITGQSKSTQTIRHTAMHGLRQFGTFEVDVLPMVEGITKYSAFVDEPAKIRYHLEKAVTLALEGRPGPVFLDIPVDVQGAFIDPEQLDGYAGTDVKRFSVSHEVVDDVIMRLRQARRPILLVGHGLRVAGEVGRFERLLDLFNIPVVVTPMAADALWYDHPLFVGKVGMKSDRPGNFAVQMADLILSLGCSFHVMTTGYELDLFAPRAWKIQVEPDEMILRREQVGVQQKVHCDLATFLEALEERLKREPVIPLQPKGTWHSRVSSWKVEFAVANEPHERNGDEINYYDFNDALSDLCQGDETIVADAGSAFYVIGQAFRVKKGQRVLISGGLGTMGYALPASAGACAADTSRKVICVTGDGSLQTNIHDLATLRLNEMNAKLFIPNNQGYVSIRNTQSNFFAGHLVGTGPESGVFFPDLSKIAEAYKLPYFRIERRSELRATMEKVLSAPGPVVCEVMTMVNQQIWPYVTSRKLPDGRMVSQPLHNMAPFIDEERLRKIICDDG